MSIYSDYALGYMDDDEFRNACKEENARERYFDERQMILDSLWCQCNDCQYHDEETGECEYGFSYTNCPELGSGEG
jgi:hypothetical protein